MDKIRKAVIPVLDFDLSMLPATKAVSQEMLPLVDRPLIQYLVDEAQSSGIETILMVGDNRSRAIEDYFETDPALEHHLRQSGKVKQLRQLEKITEISVYYTYRPYLSNLWDALLAVRDFIEKEPFAVISSKDIFLRAEMPALSQLIDGFARTGKMMAGCRKVRNVFSLTGKRLMTKQLLPNRSRIYKIIRQEEPAGEPMELAGRFIFTPDFFDAFPQRSTQDISFFSFIQKLGKEEKILAYALEGKCYEIEGTIGFLKATVEAALQRDEFGHDFSDYLKKLRL
jgi:UTP--glucose-1-phosphate uridylyltransferase